MRIVDPTGMVGEDGIGDKVKKFLQTKTGKAITHAGAMVGDVMQVVGSGTEFVAGVGTGTVPVVLHGAFGVVHGAFGAVLNFGNAVNAITGYESNNPAGGMFEYIAANSFGSGSKEQSFGAGFDALYSMTHGNFLKAVSNLIKDPKLLANIQSLIAEGAGAGWSLKTVIEKINEAQKAQQKKEKEEEKRRKEEEEKRKKEEQQESE